MDGKQEQLVRLIQYLHDGPLLTRAARRKKGGKENGYGSKISYVAGSLVPTGAISDLCVEPFAELVLPEAKGGCWRFRVFSISLGFSIIRSLLYVCS